MEEALLCYADSQRRIGVFAAEQVQARLESEIPPGFEFDEEEEEEEAET